MKIVGEIKPKGVRAESISRFILTYLVSLLRTVSIAMCGDCSRNFVGRQRQQRVVRLSHGERRLGRKRWSPGTGQHRGASRKRRTATRLLSTANATPKPCSKTVGEATGELAPPQSSQHCSWNEGEKVRNENCAPFQSNIFLCYLVSFRIISMVVITMAD